MCGAKVTNFVMEDRHRIAEEKEEHQDFTAVVRSLGVGRKWEGLVFAQQGGESMKGHGGNKERSDQNKRNRGKGKYGGERAEREELSTEYSSVWDVAKISKGETTGEGSGKRQPQKSQSWGAREDEN